MVKKITVALPVHVKKFLLFEYNGYQRKGHDEIHVDKNSELGKLIHLISRPIPYIQKTERPKSNTGGHLTIRYYTHVQSMEVDVTKLSQLATYLDELFRRSLINEVRGAHELSGGDYGPFVTRFLERRGILRDIDVDFQTMRKIYRDYISKTLKKMQKLEKSYA